MTRAVVSWVAVVLLAAAGGLTVAAIDRWPAGAPAVDAPVEGPSSAPGPSSWAGFR